MSIKDDYNDFSNFFVAANYISLVYYVLTPWGWEKENNFMYYITGNLNQKESPYLNFNNGTYAKFMSTDVYLKSTYRK